MGFAQGSQAVMAIAVICGLELNLTACQADPPAIERATISPKDTLLRPPYLDTGSTSPKLDRPGQITGDGYGNKKGLLLESGLILLWSSDEFGGFNGAAGLWDPKLSRFEPISVNLNAYPPKQHLSYRDGQIFIDEKSLGRPIWYDPFRQTWVSDEPIGINWKFIHGGWRKRPIAGGWILQQDETPGGPHAWELLNPKTGSRTPLSGVPVTGKEVGRSDGRIVFLYGKHSQILDPSTGALTSGPDIKLSAWEEVSLLPGDKVLLAGGAVPKGPVPEGTEPDGMEGYYEPIRGLYEMDLFTFAVRRVAKLRFERIRGFAMVPTPDGKLLIAGGTYGFGPNGSSPTPDVEWRDLRTFRDSVGFRLLSDRTGGMLRELKNGKVLITVGRDWNGSGGYHQQNEIPMNTPELFDPVKGTSVALKPIPEDMNPIQILSDGTLLLYDIKNDKTYPQPPNWPIKLIRYDPASGRSEPAGDLKTSHPRNNLKLTGDQVLFLAPTNFNDFDSAVTDIELWDSKKGIQHMSIAPYRYLRALCTLKDGRLLLQAILPGKKQGIQTYTLTPETLRVERIENPTTQNLLSYGIQLRDGRVLICGGWEYNYSARRGFYFLDEVWDPVSGCYFRWPKEFLEPVEDKAMKKKYLVPKVSFKEVAQGLGLPSETSDQEILGRLLHPVQRQEQHLLLRDGRIMFIDGSRVSFYPASQGYLPITH